MVISPFVWYSNYHLRFVADSNDQILKLPLLSNELGLIGNITVILATLLLRWYDVITIYYQSHTFKQLPFIQSTHASLQLYS
jgi:hypothetical protein